MADVKVEMVKPDGPTGDEEQDKKIEDLIEKLKENLTDFKSTLGKNQEEDLTSAKLWLFVICVSIAAFLIAFFVYKLIASLREKEKAKEEKKKLKLQRKEKEQARKLKKK
ncbi:uncharacterized protein LOC141913943 [Tubulanus polymorphus]|uniref:uncharacterized protein LOC141913943 n=1 Tax=Tubulanus polymorphus TaxID=672921 RepID=UPI003DA6586F